MGMRGHVIKIATTIDDHGGERQIEHERLLRLLYAEIQFVLDDPRFAGLSPSLYTSYNDD